VEGLLLKYEIQISAKVYLCLKNFEATWVGLEGIKESDKKLDTLK